MNFIRKRNVVLAALLALVLGLSCSRSRDEPASAGPAMHPLDPLTAPEYNALVRVLNDKGLADGRSRYPLVTLQEPDKASVTAWVPGDSLHRRAFAIVKKGLETFEAVVDVSSDSLVSWKQVDGVQPGVLMTEEWDDVQRIVQMDPRWQEALRKRGFEDFQSVVCVPIGTGYFGIAEEAGRRLVKVVTYDARETKNYWGRPVEGLIVVVDQNERAVVRVDDSGVVPIPPGAVDLNESSIGSQRDTGNPVLIHQPGGPGFDVDGYEVAWQKWRFRFRIDPREGIVISMVRYEDAGRLRSILYRASLSELFVPYMDPDIGWYFRTYMDAGEYGLGKLVAPIEKGLDCPDNAVLVDAVFANDFGSPYRRERAACLFERYAGDVAWRHYEAVTGENDVRRRTDLVLRSISAVGNYDYIFDWVFRQDGSIVVRVGATGVEQIKAITSRTFTDDTQGDETRYGHMVAEHSLAINHDHFFSFRLDFDVDGPQNSVVIDRLKTERLGAGHPRRSVWVTDSETLTSELPARLRINLEKPALWRVVNPNKRGRMGYPVGYLLKPGSNAVSLLSPDDFPQRRAGFTDYHLWVTPHRPAERYAAGTYPNYSRGGDGLPAWTSADRSIEDTDVVLWYTMGFHHVVRAEDWPVLSTGWTEFELRPFDFFEHNPALDLPAR
ncbi:MAG: primary-amine oxidase [Candidatus Krumholzibacteriota bacterium]|nr:primary-amine oxidase [Candidatus Krumholzibacteriota bacterium]